MTGCSAECCFGMTYVELYGVCNWCVLYVFVVCGAGISVDVVYYSALLSPSASFVVPHVMSQLSR